MVYYCPMSAFDTPSAAKRLGMPHKALVNWLYRNPEYRPKNRVGFNYIWTDAEIEAVRQRRIELRSRKPKTSQKL